MVWAVALRERLAGMRFLPLAFDLAEDFVVDLRAVEGFFLEEVVEEEDLCVEDLEEVWGSGARARAAAPKELVSRKPSRTTD